MRSILTPFHVMNLTDLASGMMLAQTVGRTAVRPAKAVKNCQRHSHDPVVPADVEAMYIVPPSGWMCPRKAGAEDQSCRHMTGREAFEILRSPRQTGDHC